MSLETATYLDALVLTNPLGADQRLTADDHVRLLKACLQRSFNRVNGVCSASSAEFNILNGAQAGGVTTVELQRLADATATLQAQIDAKNQADHLHAKTIRSASANGLLQLGDAFNAIHNVGTAAATVLLTIPPEVSVTWSANTEIELIREGAAAFAITAGAGVTISALGDSRTLSSQYSMAVLKLVSTDLWIFSGDLG